MLCASQVSLSRNGRSILHQIDLSLPAGEIVVLLGPNGAGKSTLLQVLSGALLPLSGNCTLEGRGLEKWTVRELACRRAVLDVQAVPLFPLAVRDLLAMGGVPVPAADRAARINAMLAEYRLMEFAGRDARMLSAGELQRANLARVHLQISGALRAGEYACLMLDEPTAHLDPAWQLELVQSLRALAEQGVAQLLVLHDLELAMTLADRVLLLKEGRMLASGPPAEVLTPTCLQSLYGVRFSGAPGNGHAPRLQLAEPMSKYPC